MTESLPAFTSCTLCRSNGRACCAGRPAVAMPWPTPYQQGTCEAVLAIPPVNIKHAGRARPGGVPPQAMLPTSWKNSDSTSPLCGAAACTSACLPNLAYLRSHHPQSTPTNSTHNSAATGVIAQQGTSPPVSQPRSRMYTQSLHTCTHSTKPHTVGSCNKQPGPAWP